MTPNPEIPDRIDEILNQSHKDGYFPNNKRTHQEYGSNLTTAVSLGLLYSNGKLYRLTEKGAMCVLSGRGYLDFLSIQQQNLIAKNTTNEPTQKFLVKNGSKILSWVFDNIVKIIVGIITFYLLVKLGLR